HNYVPGNCARTIPGLGESRTGPALHLQCLRFSIGCICGNFSNCALKAVFESEDIACGYARWSQRCAPDCSPQTCCVTTRRMISVLGLQQRKPVANAS